MRTAGIVAVLATAMAGLVSQGAPPAPQGEQAAVPTVTLVGCVERVEPPAAPAGKTAAPAYKLIDIQPGTGQQTQKPLTPETQYLLEAPAGIKLSDFQNQRIEVTGTLTANPRPADSAQRGAARGAPTLATTLNVKSAKVVSTECKAPRV